MDRFTLHMHLIAFVFGGIEGVDDEVMSTTRDFVRRELMSGAIKGEVKPFRGV